MPIELGRTYKDVISGFTGVAIGHVNYLTGCNQTLLAPKAEDAKTYDTCWFDDQRLEQVGSSKIVLDPVASAANPGCDRAAPKR